MSYNGWRNYETWDLSLWLHNDRGLYDNIMTEIEVYKEDGLSKDQAADELYRYIDNLVDETIDYYREQVDGFIGDYIGTFSDDLDIDAVVESFLEDYGRVRSNSPRSKKATEPKAKKPVKRRC